MRSLFVVAMTAALACTPLAAAEATPANTPTRSTVDLALPRPTGPASVGRATFALTDDSRTDPWVPEAGPRRLMVTVFYPAVPHTGTRASYMDIDEANALVDFGGFGDQLPGSRLAATRTWSRAGARPIMGPHPLVLLSPGFTVTRHTLTALAEDLASRGNLVAAVDHAYESVAAKFPAACCRARPASCPTRSAWRPSRSTAART